MTGPPRLYLVDGSALAYRSFFALGRSSLATSAGEPTGAVFGFASTLWSLLREYRPDYVAVVFDTAAPTFRHEEFEAYKANRAEMPEDLSRQFPLLHQLVQAWPLSLLMRDGVEADDIIGSYAAQLAGPDLEVVLVSGDKDFCQLVNDHVIILNPGRGGPSKVEVHWLDADGVVAKFGVPPDRVIDVLALMGDTADNVPGVPGIGEKTAAQLIREFGDLETLLASIDRVPRKVVQEKLRNHAGQARLSRRLVTIRTDLDLPAPLESLRLKPPESSLVDFFRRMEFGRLTRDTESVVRAAEAMTRGPAAPGGATVDADSPEAAAGVAAPADFHPADLFAAVGTTGPPSTAWLQEAPPTEADYRTVDTPAGLEELARELGAAGRPLAIDTETTGLDPMRAALVGISLANAPGRAFYVPVAHTTGPNVALPEVRRILGPLLADRAVPKVGQNIKYDLVIFDRHGLPVGGVAFDTMLASYLLDPAGSHKLDNLAQDLLGYRMIPMTDLIGQGAKQRLFGEVPVPLATRYSAEDADITLRLREQLGPPLAERELDGLFHDVEMPLLLVLKEMERTGVALDCPFLAAMSVRLGARAGAARGLRPGDGRRAVQRQLAGAARQAPLREAEAAGRPEDEDRLVDRQRGAGGAGPLHPLPKLVLEYRQLAKLKSTYVDALPRLVHPETGRVHTSFNQTVAATGRLSSSDPNLQNIPIRTHAGARGPARVRGRRTGPGARLGRLLADRTADPGPPLGGRAAQRRRSAAASTSTGETAASIFGVPLEPGHGRAAGPGQDGQLRRHLRPGAAGAGPPARHHPRRGPSLHRRLPGPVPRRDRLPRADAPGGHAGRLRDHAAQAAPLPSQPGRNPGAAAGRGRADGHQHADPGDGRRSDQGGDDRRRTGGSVERHPAGPPAAAGPRRTGAGGAGGGGPGGGGAGQARPWRGARTERAGRGGGRHRPRTGPRSTDPPRGGRPGPPAPLAGARPTLYSRAPACSASVSPATSPRASRWWRAFWKIAARSSSMPTGSVTN